MCVTHQMWEQGGVGVQSEMCHGNHKIHTGIWGGVVGGVVRGACGGGAEICKVHPFNITVHPDNAINGVVCVWANQPQLGEGRYGKKV